jgi:density-regulated protein DRP1
VSDVPKLLAKYAGKEEALFTALSKKYGSEPLDPYLAAKYGIGEEESDSGGESGGEEEEVVDEHTAADEEARQALSGMKLAQAAAAEKVAGEAGPDGKKAKARGVAVKATQKVDTRVVIQKLARQRKKAVTVVVGMDTVPDVKMKEAAKAFAKRFAGSSSVKKDASGREEIVLQGDHQEDCAVFIVKTFKVKKECVFLDIDGEFVGVV